MAEYSYPVVNQPMTADGWRSVTLGVGNGILDQGGFPYRLTNFSNVDNTAVIKNPTLEGKQFAHAILEGFYHRIDADVTLSFPAVPSRTTYYVVLQYDPLNTTVPVQLKVVTSLDYTQGKNYLHLYNVTRNANELLSDAAVRMIRPRVAPVQVYATEADLPQAHKTLWGTLAVVHNGRSNSATKILMALNGNDSTGDNDTWFWKTVYQQSDPGWYPVADTANAQNGASGYNKAIQRDGKTRRMVGRFNRGVAGSNYNPTAESGYLVASLATRDLPAASSRHIVYGGAGIVTVVAEVSRANAEVRVWVKEQCSYIDLGMIQWIAEVDA